MAEKEQTDNPNEPEVASPHPDFELRETTLAEDAEEIANLTDSMTGFTTRIATAGPSPAHYYE